MATDPNSTHLLRQMQRTALPTITASKWYCMIVRLRSQSIVRQKASASDSSKDGKKKEIKTAPEKNTKNQAPAYTNRLMAVQPSTHPKNAPAAAHTFQPFKQNDFVVLLLEANILVIAATFFFDVRSFIGSFSCSTFATQPCVASGSVPTMFRHRRQLKILSLRITHSA